MIRESMKQSAAQLWLLVLVLLWASNVQMEAQTPPVNAKPSDTLDSPRLQSLKSALKNGGRQAVQKFWDEIEGQAPLIESIEGDDASRRVTFLWRGGDEVQGFVISGPFPLPLRRRPLTRLENTDVWFLTARLPADTRVSYSFLSSSDRQFADPLNADSWQNTSPLVLPKAPPRPWVTARPESPKGTLTEHKLRSEILKEERGFSIYTPAGFDPRSKTYGLLVVFDGEEYRSLVPVPIILDNLIAKGRIIPTVAILVDSETRNQRNRDLYCYAPFADFVGKELLSWTVRNYHLKPDPRHTIVAGSSAGGLAAAYCAWRHPEVFGNVLSQSGAFYYYPGWKQDEETRFSPFGWLSRQFVNSRKLPIRFYLEAGLFEAGEVINLLAENRRLRDVLEAKGYTVVYREFAGGHEYFSWRGSFADGLLALAAQN